LLSNIDIEDIKRLAHKAGDAIMSIYEKDFSIEYKDDSSPLTQADIEANNIICNYLQKNYPEIPILSEESKQIPYVDRKNWEYYWCVDPIDGTKEFIKKNGEFTVNIALIHKNNPVLGVVYAPVLDLMYYAKEKEGAFRNGERLPIQREDNSYTIVASKSHMSNETQHYIDKIATTKKKKLVSMGSSLKICLVADGSADIYPRFAPTMEWDTAAAHAIVRQSKKKILEYNSSEEIHYNKNDLLNPWFIVK